MVDRLYVPKNSFHVAGLPQTPSSTVAQNRTQECRNGMWRGWRLYLMWKGIPGSWYKQAADGGSTFCSQLHPCSSILPWCLGVTESRIWPPAIALLLPLSSLLFSLPLFSSLFPFFFFPLPDFYKCLFYASHPSCQRPINYYFSSTSNLSFFLLKTFCRHRERDAFISLAGDIPVTYI